jgi:hypothetical protein
MSSLGAEFKAAHPEEVGADGVIRVCIGGGAGFIGSHIAKRLMAEVFIITNYCILVYSYFCIYVCIV